MFYNAKNHTLTIDGDTTDFISFGKGKKNLVIIPGVGDGLKTAKGLAIPFAFMYRLFAKDFTVYVMSRKRNIPENYSTQQMAADMHKVLQSVGVEKTSVLGVSMGGMIAQYLAIDFPEFVEKIVLAVTLARPNDTVKERCETWIKSAEEKDYQAIMKDSALYSYSDEYLRKNKMMLNVISKIGAPKSFDRFITFSKACTTHNSYEKLEKITCPTLVIGGMQDKIVTYKASEEIASKIPNAKLKTYEKFGHALYEEGNDFNKTVYEFCMGNETLLEKIDK